MHSTMNDLLKTAYEYERNAERLAAWMKRYKKRFGVLPNGNIRRHQRCCTLDDVARLHPLV